MADFSRRYRVERPLGRGGIGETFLVVDTEEDGRLLVLKKVPKTAFPKKVESLRQEFVALSRLAHPNIARVFDFFEDQESYCFVEEYVDGPDLFRATHEANYNQVLISLVQILRALNYLHRQGWIHGDLKPENILVVRNASLFQEDAVKLIDFGLARQVGERRTEGSGSLHFMAPEILLERPYDHRADLYALGVCLYRMITGRYPFEGERLDRLVAAQIERMPAEPRRFRMDLPKGLNELTMRLLSKSPEGRFESAAAVLRTLNELEGGKFPLWTEVELRYCLRLPLWREGKIVPPPWALPEITLFLRERLRLKEIPRAWEEVLEELTGGDPGRVALLAESWLSEGVVKVEGDSARFQRVEPWHLADLESIAKKRFDRLERQRRQLLGLLTFANYPLSKDLLQRISGFSKDLLDPLLQSLEEGRWLRRVLHGGTYHYRLADEKIGELLEVLPKELSDDSLLNLVEETYRGGRHQLARRHIEELLSGRPREIAPRWRRRFLELASLVFLETGDLLRSKECCEEIQGSPDLDPAERGKVLNRLGWIAYREGNYVEALRIFEDSERHWGQTDDTFGKASVANFQGMVHQALRRWGEAMEAYRRGLALLKEGDPHLPLLRMNLATCAQEARDYETAVREYEAAREVLASAKDRHFAARLLLNLANLYLFLGRLDRAGEAAHASLRIALENGLSNIEGHNYLILSVIADKEGNLKEFQHLVEKAASLFESHGTEAEKATGRLHQAYYWFTEGRDEKACKLLSDVRTSFPSEIQILAQCDLLEGKLAARQEPPDRLSGEPPLKRALLFFEERGDEANLWDTTFTLGRLFRGRPEEARPFFERSLKILEHLAEKIPKEAREAFFRDRKREKILSELQRLKPLPEGVPNPKEGRPMTTPSFTEIVRINRLLASEHNLTALLETILEESLGLLEAERGFILLLEEGGFRIRVSRNLDRQALEADESRYSTTIARRSAATAQSILVTDAQADERFREAESVVALDLQAVLAVPMKIGAEVVGVIYVDNRFHRGRFDETHQRLLEAFADQAALALRNARQLEEIRVRQRELEASKRKIEELNQLLQERLDVTEKELSTVQERYQRQQEELKLKYAYDQIIGKSPKLREALKVVDRVVDSDVTVLLMGESGTGKELMARALHFNGPRKEAPFMAENCAAFSETLLESELFGHLKGSFTDAVADRQGLLEAANGGTVFLDEIGDMPLGLQSKLLRVLQERKVRPIGSNEYRKVDVRLVTATNKNLAQLVKQEKFREDLFYRINVVRVVVPPLRERKEDIPLLVDRFLKRSRDESGRTVRLAPKTLEFLIHYDWPGNVRELQNEIEKCCALGAKILSPEHLSETIREEPSAAHRVISLGQQVASAEKVVILEALKKYRYSRIKTSQALGVSRITLYKKMKAYGIAARRMEG